VSVVLYILWAGRRIEYAAAFRPVGAMAGIARNIEWYNSAYALAWKHVSELQKREQPEIARRLHDCIRRQLANGATEPLIIASDALKALDERSET